ncbi:laccase-4-like protein [Lasius niger]|uniref:Laccase-4-like protein n=1 Tax=Lasius niger TaxID=67767 RepID=A0A0J7L6N8_LASNI|nr:laccase-4-like protein [Lasius niger]
MRGLSIESDRLLGQALRFCGWTETGHPYGQSSNARTQYSGADVTNGIFGSLIVKQADLREPHRTLYDIDDPNHVILVTHWQHSPEVSFNQGHAKPAILLINGRGRQPSGPTVPLNTFTVIPGRRHRFRVANAGGAGACPVTLFIDGHTLLLIALDGHPIEPRQVTSITLAKGLSPV